MAVRKISTCSPCRGRGLPCSPHPQLHPQSVPHGRSPLTGIKEQGEFPAMFLQSLGLGTGRFAELGMEAWVIPTLPPVKLRWALAEPGEQDGCRPRWDAGSWGTRQVLRCTFGKGWKTPWPCLGLLAGGSEAAEGALAAAAGSWGRGCCAKPTLLAPSWAARPSRCLLLAPPSANANSPFCTEEKKKKRWLWAGASTQRCYCGLASGRDTGANQLPWRRLCRSAESAQCDSVLLNYRYRRKRSSWWLLFSSSFSLLTAGSFLCLGLNDPEYISTAGEVCLRLMRVGENQGKFKTR